MVQEKTDGKQPEATITSAPNKVSLHIYMPAEAYARIKKFAEYAVLEGLIEGHARGNVASYCNFCFNLGEQHLSQHMLTKRGYK